MRRDRQAMDDAIAEWRAAQWSTVAWVAGAVTLGCVVSTFVLMAWAAVVGLR